MTPVYLGACSGWVWVSAIQSPLYWIFRILQEFMQLMYTVNWVNTNWMRGKPATHWRKRRRGDMDDIFIEIEVELDMQNSSVIRTFG